MNRALLQQALDALEHCVMSSGGETGCEHQFGICFCAENAAIESLRTELAKPESEPVGYVYWAKGHAEGALDNQTLKPGTPLYTKDQL